MDRLRDKAWAYVLGLAVLSLVITVLEVAGIDAGAPDPVAPVLLPLIASICGTIGTFCSALLAYETTAQYTSPIVRTILLTMVTLGMAFVFASIPFFLLGPLIAVDAWLMGVNLMALPALGLTAIWSVVYLAKFGPDRTKRAQPSARNNLARLLWFVIAGTISILTVMKAIK